MPRTKRQELKRVTMQGYKHLEHSLMELAKLHALFENHPSNYDKMLETIATCIMMAQEGIVAFATNAWGKFPKNLDDWK